MSARLEHALRATALACAALGASAMPLAHAQDPLSDGIPSGGTQADGTHAGHAMRGMDHAAMNEMSSDSSDPVQATTMRMDDAATGGAASEGKASAGDRSAMSHMDMAMGMPAMQGGDAPGDARDPDYSDGLHHGSMTGMDMVDDATHAALMFNTLESTHGQDGTGHALDAQAWIGGDLDKLWLKVDGERGPRGLGATRTEAFWDHALAPYWSTQVGIRHDLGGGPSRDWAAVGVQGLAPWWFDIEATAYVGSSGRSALRVEAEYDILFTQRLVLQPDVELNAYGKRDRARGIGSGLSDIDVGLRLRYEVTRKFAPYVGIVWSRRFGETADMARDAGEQVEDTQAVIGFRAWF